jgi:hypothetical protein
MQGTLGACPYHPDLMHDDVITDIELLWKIHNSLKINELRARPRPAALSHWKWTSYASENLSVRWFC